jgi:hypothetical protein
MRFEVGTLNATLGPIVAYVTWFMVTITSAFGLRGLPSVCTKCFHLPVLANMFQTFYAFWGDVSKLSSASCVSCVTSLSTSAVNGAIFCPTKHPCLVLNTCLQFYRKMFSTKEQAKPKAAFSNKAQYSSGNKVLLQYEIMHFNNIQTGLMNRILPWSDM